MQMLRKLLSMTTSAETVDLAWKSAYKAGCIALIIAAVLYILGIFPGLGLGPVPTTGEGFITWAGQTTLGNAAFMLSVSADAFFILGGLALYLALKDVRKFSMLVGIALWEVSIVLDLPRLFVAYSASSLSSGYAATTSEAQKAAYVAASDLAFGISYGAALVVTIVIVYVSTLIMSWVMLRGVFGKGIAYLGIVASIVGLIGSPYSPALFPIGALEIAFLIGYVLLSIWGILAGYRLYKLGSQSA
jgi:hypothetical protein